MTNVNADPGLMHEPSVEITRFGLNWGAIFGGLVVAMALQILFSLLGVAIGFAAWDPGDPARDLGIGASLWWLATGLISLFVGATTTGRLAGALRRRDGALHGIVMWGLSLVLGIFLVTSGAGNLIGGASNLVGRTVAASVGGATGRSASAGEVLQQQAKAAERQLGVRTDTLGARMGTAAERATSGLATAAWLSLLALGLGLAVSAYGASRSVQDYT